MSIKMGEACEMVTVRSCYFMRKFAVRLDSTSRCRVVSNERLGHSNQAPLSHSASLFTTCISSQGLLSVSQQDVYILRAKEISWRYKPSLPLVRRVRGVSGSLERPAERCPLLFGISGLILCALL